MSAQLPSYPPREDVWRFPTAIRRIEPERRAADEPLDAWLGDWDRLLEARASFADAIEQDTTAQFTEPEADGAPISERMDAVGSLACTVPEPLLEPDAGLSSST